MIVEKLTSLLIGVSLWVSLIPNINSTRPFALSASEPIALVAQPEGTIHLRHGRTSNLLTATTFLYEGDVLVAGNSGGGVIYQVFAPIQRIKTNERRTISRISSPMSDSAVTPEEFAQLRKQYGKALANRDRKSPHHLGNPSELKLTLIAPRNDSVLDGTPTLEWAPLNVPTEYRVSIYDNSEKLLWQMVQSGSNAKCPIVLKPGNYKWDVIAEVNHQRVYDAASFTVIRQEDAARITGLVNRAQSLVNSDDSANLVLISLLIEEQLYRQAEVEIKNALTRNPNDQALWDLLMQTYDYAERWEDREIARRQRPRRTFRSAPN
jgi:predicted Zn-dependent protease